MNLESLLRGKYSVESANRALRWWARRPDSRKRQLRVFRRLLPILGRVMSGWRVPRGAWEDFAAGVASHLWEVIARKYTYWLLSSRGKVSSRRLKGIVYLAHRDVWEMETDQGKRPDDVLSAQLTWMEPLARASHHSRASDLLLLKELPIVVARRVAQSSRLRAPAEREALQFFVRMLLRVQEGRMENTLRGEDIERAFLRLRAYAINLLGLAKDRVRFVFDYAVVRTRCVLLDEHAHYRDAVVQGPPPVSVEWRAVGC